MKYTTKLRVGQIWVDKSGVEIFINWIATDKSMFDYECVNDYKTNSWDDIELYSVSIKDLNKFTYTGKYFYNSYKIEAIRDMINEIKVSLEK